MMLLYVFIVGVTKQPLVDGFYGDVFVCHCFTKWILVMFDWQHIEMVIKMHYICQLGHLSVKTYVSSMSYAECQEISSHCCQLLRWIHTVVVIWSRKAYNLCHRTHTFMSCQVDTAICLLPMLIFTVRGMALRFLVAAAKHLWHTATLQLINSCDRRKAIGGRWTRQKSPAITARRVQWDTVERCPPAAAAVIKDFMAVSHVGLLVHIYVSSVICYFPSPLSPALYWKMIS